MCAGIVVSRPAAFTVKSASVAAHATEPAAETDIQAVGQGRSLAVGPVALGLRLYLRQPDEPSIGSRAVHHDVRVRREDRPKHLHVPRDVHLGQLVEDGSHSGLRHLVCLHGTSPLCTGLSGLRSVIMNRA